MIEGPYTARRYDCTTRRRYSVESIFIFACVLAGCAFLGNLAWAYFVANDFFKLIPLVSCTVAFIGSILLGSDNWRLVGSIIFASLGLFIRYVID